MIDNYFEPELYDILIEVQKLINLEAKRKD